MSEEIRIGIPFLEPVWPYVDPATDYTPVSMNVVYNVYERLVNVTDVPGGGVRVEPGLASDWSVSDDGRAYRFELRHDAGFTDGRRLSSDDVVFSLERLLKMAEPPSHLLPIEAVRKVDDTTVEVFFERPTAAALIALSSPAASIVDHTALQHFHDLGREWLTSHSAGSGPFHLESLDDERVVLRRNPGYWGSPPTIDRVVLVDTPDPVSQLDMLRSGELHILLSVGPDAFERLSTDSDYVSQRFASIQCPNVTLLKGTVGPDGRSLPENHEFTSALKYAIDYDRIAGLFGGWGNGASPAQSGFIPAITGYDEGLAAHYRHDRHLAARLLADSGYAGGFEIEFTYWDGSWGGVNTESVARSIAQDLESVGMTPHLRSYSGEEYFSLLLDQRVLTGITLSMSIYQMPDPEDVFRRKTTYLDLTGYEYGMESRLDAAAAESDPEHRQGLYRSLQLEFLDVAPLIFLLTYPHRVVRRKEVTGYLHGASMPGPRFAELGMTEPSS